jgi:hypothetical protein
MKKILGMLGAIGLVATSSATVVSCGDSPAAESEKTLDSLNGQSFTQSLTEMDSIKKDNSDAWGGKDEDGTVNHRLLGYLQSTLSSINTKADQDDGYSVQNKEVGAYLTKGESVKWETPTTIVDANETAVALDATDGNSTVLEVGYVCTLNLTVLSYFHDENNELQSTPHSITITITITE